MTRGSGFLDRRLKFLDFLAVQFFEEFGDALAVVLDDAFHFGVISFEDVHDFLPLLGREVFVGHRVDVLMAI
jgi:hypothetical protein